MHNNFYCGSYSNIITVGKFLFMYGVSMVQRCIYVYVPEELCVLI